MEDSPGRRVLYTCLIVFAGVLPFVGLLVSGGGACALFPLVTVLFLIAFLRSRREREEARPGFPVLLNREVSANPADSNDRSNSN